MVTAPARTRGFTLVELLASLVIIIILLALLVPAWSRSRRHARVESCADNLRLLHRADREARTASGAPPGETGKAYWLRLSRGAKPALDSASPVYSCPLREPPRPEDGCAYYGPAGAVDPLSDSDPIGCDEPASHSADGREGGNVLLKSGGVQTDNTGLWFTAIRGGKCRP